MNKVFIDSNIWLYAFIKSEEKTKKASHIIKTEQIICLSKQVINEICYNLIKKAGFKEKQITSLINDFYTSYFISDFSHDSMLLASQIRKKHSISFWDSHIIANALISDCDILFSEDMQDGLIINKKLTIKNPFKSI